MQPIVRLGEVGRLATPPPYIKYNEEVHMRIHGPAGGEFEGDRDWEWIGRLNHLYPANRVADKVITASASNTNDGNSGSGDVVGAMKEEDARAGARCTCKATWYFEGESFHGCHTEHAVAPWCFGGAGCDLKGMIGSLDNEYELSWMLCQEDGKRVSHTAHTSRWCSARARALGEKLGRILMEGCVIIPAGEVRHAPSVSVSLEVALCSIRFYANVHKFYDILH